VRSGGRTVKDRLPPQNSRRPNCRGDSGSYRNSEGPEATPMFSAPIGRMCRRRKAPACGAFGVGAHHQARDSGGGRSHETHFCWSVHSRPAAAHYERFALRDDTAAACRHRLLRSRSRGSRCRRGAGRFSRAAMDFSGTDCPCACRSNARHAMPNTPVGPVHGISSREACAEFALRGRSGSCESRAVRAEGRQTYISLSTRCLDALQSCALDKPAAKHIREYPQSGRKTAAALRSTMKSREQEPAVIERPSGCVKQAFWRSS
jgi:hypothetical protein